MGNAKGFWFHAFNQKKIFYYPSATMHSIGLLIVIKILNFLWWHIPRWVSDVFILPSVSGSCPDYSSVAHTGLQVHGYLYQKGNLIRTCPKNPIQKKWIWRLDCANPMDLSVHFKVEMRKETFSEFSETEIVLVCLEQIQSKMLFARLYLVGKIKVYELHTVVEKILWLNISTTSLL